MPFIHKEKKSQEKMYVVVDLNHAGPKLLSQLHSGIQGKKDKYVLRYQGLDSGHAVIYLKNVDKIINLNSIKNNQAIQDHREKVKKLLLASVKKCETCQEFFSVTKFQNALKNINDLACIKNHDITVGELKQSLKTISNVVRSPLRRKRMEELREKYKLLQFETSDSPRLFYLHLNRFISMDKVENKNLQKFLTLGAFDNEENLGLDMVREIEKMQLFIARVVCFEAKEKASLVGFFNRSKWKSEIDSFCKHWENARIHHATLENRRKANIFGWRKEMDFIAKIIVDGNKNSEIKKINKTELHSKNLLVPPISPLGREVFKVGSKNNLNTTRFDKLDKRINEKKISRVLNYSILENEESSIVESSEQSKTSSI